MPKKGQLTRNSGQWTEARYRSFVVSALRASFRRWPARGRVMHMAATERRINPSSGRLAWHYRCNHCQQDFPAKSVQVDHVVPIVDPAVGFAGWDAFIARLYTEDKGLQVLCKPCHQVKGARDKAMVPPIR